MFRNKAPIPASGLHSLRFPDLDDYGFPGFLEIEANASFDERIAAIRQDIASSTGNFVRIPRPGVTHLLSRRVRSTGYFLNPSWSTLTTSKVCTVRSLCG